VPVDLLIVGAGAYVCGTGPDQLGTVLPTALGLQRDGRVGRLRVAATRPESAEACREKVARLAGLLRCEPDVEILPGGGGPDPEAYLAAAARSPAPQAAVVVVPDALHHAVTSRLLDRGLHCLVVKPLAPTAAEARDLAERARRRDLLGQVEFHKRFDDANRLLRREASRGSLGEIASVLVEYSQRRSIPLGAFRRWAATSHPFQYLGVHYVDLVQHALGARPLRACAVGSRRLLAGEGIDTWDSVQALVAWRGPRGETFHASYATSWVDPEASTAMSNQIVKVIGTRARFDSDQKNRGVELVGGSATEAVNPYFSQLLPGPGDEPPLTAEGYGPRSVAGFVEDVEAFRAGRRRPSVACSFDEAVVSSAVSEAVTRSLEDGGAWKPVEAEVRAPGARRSAAVRPAAGA